MADPIENVDPSVAEAIEPTPDASSTQAQSDTDASTANADPVTAPVEPANESQDPAVAAKPKKGTAQARIEELAKAVKDLREHNKWLQERALSGKPAPAPQAQAPAIEVSDEAPTLETVGYDPAKLAKEQAAWLKRQVQKGVDDALSTREAQADARSQDQVVQDSAVEFRKTHPDFDDMISNPNLEFTQSIADGLKLSGENSAALGYYLATNPDKLSKLARMSAKQQTLALGRMEAEAIATAKQTTFQDDQDEPAAAPQKAPAKATAPAVTKPVTKAPPPPTPLGGTAAADMDPMTMSTTEWRKWRTKQLSDKRANDSRPKARVTVNY